MRYLIVQEWVNTKGNHTGMVHMCKLLNELYPGIYKFMVNPEPKRFKISKNKIIAKVNYWRQKWFDKYEFNRYYIKRCKEFLKGIKNDDEIFLLEYMMRLTPQLKLAQYLKKKYPKVKIYGMCHLSPSIYPVESRIYPRLISEWSPYVDKLLTLGTSLSHYFISSGIEMNKVSTGLHYVDCTYYKRKTPIQVNEKPILLVMGNMQRDKRLLYKVCKQTPTVDWIICGNLHEDENFKLLQNVELKEYLPEYELRELMENSDLSVNIMYDTVGSNVIVTSMAMGMAMICSDVGSIRNYCTDENAILCDNTVDSFVHSINEIIKKKDKIIEMKKASIEISKKFNISMVHDWFDSLSH